MGNFNDLLHHEEKRGRVNHPQWLLIGSREAVTDRGLIDLPLQGHSFTWWKSLGSNSAIEEKLDRAMVSSAWMDLFPHSTLRNLMAASSDHSPILVATETHSYVFKKRHFRFENSWLIEPELEMVVENGWTKENEEPVLVKLKNCTEELERGERLFADVIRRTLINVRGDWMRSGALI